MVLRGHYLGRFSNKRPAYRPRWIHPDHRRERVLFLFYLFFPRLYIYIYISTHRTIHVPSERADTLGAALFIITARGYYFARRAKHSARIIEPGNISARYLARLLTGWPEMHQSTRTKSTECFMLLAVTRRGNYNGRERIKGEAERLPGKRKKGLNALRGVNGAGPEGEGEGEYVLTLGLAISCYPLSYKVAGNVDLLAESCPK